MKKSDELATPTSCLNKASDDEPVFVLRAKDPLASVLVRHWAEAAERGGVHEPEKIREARGLASQMDEWRSLKGL